MTAALVQALVRMKLRVVRDGLKASMSCALSVQTMANLHRRWLPKSKWNDVVRGSWEREDAGRYGTQAKIR
jgi:hypothetical protein